MNDVTILSKEQKVPVRHYFSLADASTTNFLISRPSSDVGGSGSATTTGRSTYFFFVFRTSKIFACCCVLVVYFQSRRLSFIPIGSLYSFTMRFSFSLVLALNAAAVPKYIVAFVARPNVHSSIVSHQRDLFETTSLNASGPRTLYDKIWDDHLVDDDGLSSLIYVDRHLVHEVTSPQAFEGLRIAKRGVRRPDCTLVTVDHNVPTSDRKQLIDVKEFIEETASRTQVLQLETNVKDFGLKYFSFADERQGIVHIIGPEQGFTLPGCVTVCGDSHTATHGAFGALAFGIGTSEVEHVLATQVCSFCRIPYFVLLYRQCDSYFFQP